MSLASSGLLLNAFSPAQKWAEPACGYRQWRLLRGEAGAPDGELPRFGVDASHFEVESLLGEGNYSQIFKATLKSTQQRVALKMIDKSKAKRYKKEDEIVVERWVLRNMLHPSIVRMFHAFQEVQALYLALELLPGGELWALTHKVGLPMSLATFFGAQVLEVLQFLHERDVVHRDVKPENVLLTGDGHVKLIDFGTAKLLRHPIKLQSDEKQDNKGDRRGKFKEFVGTPEYMSPEAINNKNTDQRADLWSFGAFIAQIVTGMPPFKGGSDYLTFKRVLARKFRLPEGTPPHAASLIEALCVLEPTERLGGKWTEAADAVEPTSISGMEGRELGGHAAIRAHPLFAAYPMLDLHRVPCPTMTEEECALSDQVKLIDEIRQKEGGGGVRALGEEAAIQRAVVESWSDEWRMAVAFECGKRDLLGDEMRELLKMGPALPPLTDDLEEFATDDAEEGAAEEEAVDEDEDHEAAELREAEEERQAAASAAARGSRTLPKAEDDALGEGGVVV